MYRCVFWGHFQVKLFSVEPFLCHLEVFLLHIIFDLNLCVFPIWWFTIFPASIGLEECNGTKL